ncbi:MAG: hypothetical protein JSS89_08185 [Bacteroidetes bacterium]|nr:hypothetical protein [Bacteroidota bacterium]
MKTLLTIVLALMCGSTAAHSLCSGGGLRVFPHGSTIGSHPIFVLEGYAKSQKVITGLNKAYSIYLNSGKSKVRLMVRNVYIGQYRLTQALLYPEAELEVGQQYTLQIDSLPHGEHLTRYNHAKDEYGPVTYNVVAANDDQSPILSSRPEEVGKTLENPGCGPVSSVAFSNPAIDESEVIVMTTVKNLSSGKETTYLILPDSNKIRVGHGMCSGAFTFDDTLEYEVEFTFMDAAGNITPWSGERIRFTKPTKETE